MNRKLILSVILQLALTMGTSALAYSDSSNCVPTATESCSDVAPQAQPLTSFSTTAVNPINQSVPFTHPKVVFQINQAADAPTILRFVTNYLLAEPAAEVAVVGYAGGIDFMLKGAKDPAGKLYTDQLHLLTDKGVRFKACNNTLTSRKLAADAVAPQVTVVPGAVNEIIRLQTREGYAYFRH